LGGRDNIRRRDRHGDPGLLLMGRNDRGRKAVRPVKAAQVIVLVAWTVVPPIWFWCEYWFIYLKGQRFEDRAPENFELFKYGQDISAKIWLAIVSATFVIFFWKEIHLR
jgi:hypothetical protein